MLVRIVLLLLLSFNVAAIDYRISWDIPTLREDGSTLDINSIQGYVLEVEKDGSTLPDVSITDGRTVAYLLSLEKGSYRFRIATVTTETGGFSDYITEVVGCISYNGSGYNRRVGVKLCR